MTTARATTGITGSNFETMEGKAERYAGPSQGMQQAARIEPCTKGSSVFPSSDELVKAKGLFNLGDLLNVPNQTVCIISNDLFESGMPLHTQVSVWDSIKGANRKFSELRTKQHRYRLFKGRVYSKLNTGGEW